MLQSPKASNACRLTLDQVTADSAKFAAEFECPICTNIVEDMVCCSECETNFCRECIQAWAKKNKHCPNCREILRFDGKVPRKLQNLLDQCRFQCCDQVFTFEERHKHFSTFCKIGSRRTVRCPLNCGQPDIVVTPDCPNPIRMHVELECTSNRLKCQTCQLNVYRPSRKGKGHDCVSDLMDENRSLLDRNEMLERKV